MIELPKRTRPTIDAQINIVPYIDVMLVLLVIFMMTTPIIEQGIEVELPIASEAEIYENISEQANYVTVYQNGDYSINSIGDDDQKDERSSLESIVSNLSARRYIHPSSLVIVRGDKGASYGQVVSLWSVLKASGITNVNMSTENPDM